MKQPPKLKALHSDASLIALKLETFRRVSTETLIESLKPGTSAALKARPDGTILDGHHRIAVLRERNASVDALPREIVRKTPAGD
jgi:hypothetical protein